MDPSFQPRWAASVASLDVRPSSGAPRPAISFTYGLPDPALFPTEALATAATHVLREHSDRALQYGASAGLPQLIATLVERLNRTEGLALRGTDCLITAGAGQALGLVARALLDPGDTVLLETPAWPGILHILDRHPCRVVPVPLDDEGLDVAALERQLTALGQEGVRPKFLYTVPTFQNPTGLTLSLPRRHALLDLARRYDLLILEDEAYRDLAFDGALPPSLFALDSSGQVLRAGTYSKILAAGLRLGWILGPAALLARLSALKDDGGTSPFASYVTAAFTRAGELDPHILRLLDAYRLKRDLMLRALNRYFPPTVRWTVPAGGFFVWVTLPPGVHSAELLIRARAAGIDFLPGRACFPDPTAGAPYLRLAFSLTTPEQITEGIRRLGILLGREA